MFSSKTAIVPCVVLIITAIAGMPALIPVVHAQPPLNVKLLIEKKPIKLASARAGIILVVGTEKPGEKLPPERTVTIGSGKEARKFKKLQVGDRVAAEQIVARLDDRLALLDVEQARSKLGMAKLELEVSLLTAAEAQIRYEVATSLRFIKQYSPEEIREKKLGADRFQIEVNLRKEAVKLAQHELRRAEFMLEMRVIRSPVPGVVRAIHKSRGEGVKALEPIVEIVPDKE